MQEEHTALKHAVAKKNTEVEKLTKDLENYRHQMFEYKEMHFDEGVKDRFSMSVDEISAKLAALVRVFYSFIFVWRFVLFRSIVFTYCEFSAPLSNSSLM